MDECKPLPTGNPLQLPAGCGTGDEAGGRARGGGGGSVMDGPPPALAAVPPYVIAAAADGSAAYVFDCGGEGGGRPTSGEAVQRLELATLWCRDYSGGGEAGGGGVGGGGGGGRSGGGSGASSDGASSDGEALGLPRTGGSGPKLPGNSRSMFSSMSMSAAAAARARPSGCTVLAGWGPPAAGGGEGALGGAGGRPGGGTGTLVGARGGAVLIWRALPLAAQVRALLAARRLDEATALAETAGPGAGAYTRSRWSST